MMYNNYIFKFQFCCLFECSKQFEIRIRTNTWEVFDILPTRDQYNLVNTMFGWNRIFCTSLFGQTIIPKTRKNRYEPSGGNGTVRRSKYGQTCGNSERVSLLKVIKSTCFVYSRGRLLTACNVMKFILTLQQVYQTNESTLFGKNPKHVSASSKTVNT